MHEPNTLCHFCQTPLYRRPNQIAKAKQGVYCNKTCYGLACRKEVPCIVCGRLILSSLNKKTCGTSCAKQHLDNPNRLNCKGRKAGPSKRGGTRSFRVRLIKQRGMSCQLCGYDKHDILNIHHIVERKNGGTDDESNLMLICPNCHSEIHKGFRNLEPC